MKLFIILTLLSSSAFAKDCNYKVKKENFNVEWTAFKTPLKLGVKGKFKDLGVKKDASGTDLNSLLSGVAFKIDAKSVDTNNKGRDQKIYNFFFAPFGAVISGSIKKFKKSVLHIAMTMNEVTKVIPLKVTKKGGILSAEGVIDVLDFNLSKSLSGINGACKELHKGKTWSDVDIKLTAKYTKTCK